MRKACHYLAFLYNRPIIRNLVPDAWYLKEKYKDCMKRKLDLENPRSFNEKLQWLKVYNRNPKYTMMVDKYLVREYIASKIGEEYLIPLVGGPWKKAEDIDFDKLPDKFVLKCNHDSASVVICKDKKTINRSDTITFLNSCLKKNHYYFGREWPYKNVEPLIIAEQYMSNDGCSELNDYKLMCFDGEVKYSFVCSERFSSNLKVTFFDNDWNVMPFLRSHPKSSVEIPKPKLYDKMVELAEILSKDIPFIRVDFYEINGKIYFGELTFFPGSGFEAFQPEEWDYKLGELISLRGYYER